HLCVFAKKVTLSVIEATGCGLNLVTGVNSIPEESGIVQQAVSDYNQNGTFVGWVKVLCEVAVLAGDRRGCNATTWIDRRDISGLLDINTMQIYASKDPVTINGLDFIPQAGHSLVIAPQLDAILSSDVRVDLNDKTIIPAGPLQLSLHDVNVPLTTGNIYDRRVHVGSVGLPNGSLPGLLGLLPERG